MGQDVTKFFKLYDLIGSVDDYTFAIKVGTCRICGKSYPQTSFNKEAHLISRFLDSHHLIGDECDNCNQQFSKWENDLAHLIRPFLTLHGISPGNSKIPVFQSRSENWEAETRSVLAFGENGNRKFIIQKIDDYKINEDKKQAQFVFRKPKFVPLNVYKVLLKTAIELLPEEQLIRNEYLCKWLLGNYEVAHIYPYVFRTMIYQRAFDKPQVWLYRAKNVQVEKSIYPEYVLIFAVTNLVFQLTLPFSLDFMKFEQEGLDKTVELFPAFAFDKLELGTTQTVQIRCYDMSFDTRVSENEIITLSFDRFERQTTKL